MPVIRQVLEQWPEIKAPRLTELLYERGPIIITSNRGFEAWGEILGDAMVAAALIDRLVHHATMVTLKGKSYRLRERGTGITPAAPPQRRLKSDPPPATQQRRHLAPARPPASPPVALRATCAEAAAQPSTGLVFNRRVAHFSVPETGASRITGSPQV